jgi:glycerophosphoryl diester phosphodiesterase
MINIQGFYIKKFLLLSLIFLFSCSEKNTNTTEITINESAENVITKITSLSNDQILVCAHRAYHKFAPENSLASIQQAIDEGIDIVEVDVNTTKDGILVLMHDNLIDRTTNAKGYLSDYTYLDLKKLYLKIGDSVTSHQIPTLNEVLTLSRDKIILNLDIKRVDVNKLYQQLLVKKMQNDVFSFIWDKRKIDKILQIDSTYAVLPIVSSSVDMMNYAQNIKSKLQHFDENSFNQENLEWAKNNGILVFMNILWKPDENFIQNDTQQVDDIIALKPAIIQTDHPKKVLAYLKSKNLHN